MRVLFIDMDNTIAENTTCDNIDYHSGLYLTKRPIMFVVDAIDTLLRPEVDSVVIISKAQGGALGVMEKQAWLFSNNIEHDDEIFITDDDKKSTKILGYCVEHGIQPSDCLIVDDKKDILQDCKSKGIRVVYPQQLLVEYYSYLYSKNKEKGLK